MRFKPGALLALVLTVALSGCWDLEEADYRSFITAIGIDCPTASPQAAGAAGVPQPQQSILLTAQVPLIATMLPPGSRGGGQREKNYHTVSAPGESVFEAFRNLQSKINRHLVIQQNKLVVLGQTAARRGVPQLIQWLERDAKHPPQALVFVARHTAGEILNAEPANKNMPALDFNIAREISAKQDFSYFVPLWLFRSKIVNQSEDAFAPLLDFDAAQGQYVMDGLAVFDGNRLAGELTPGETQMFGLLTGQMRAGSLTVRRGLQKLSLRNVSAKTNIQVSLRKGKPVFRVTVTIAGAVEEMIGFHGEISVALLKKLDLFLARDARTRIAATIRKLQRLKSDPIDFGEQLRVQHPEIWSRQKWKREFATASVRVTVRAVIARDGVLR